MNQLLSVCWRERVKGSSHNDIKPCVNALYSKQDMLSLVKQTIVEYIRFSPFIWKTTMLKLFHTL